MGYATQMLVKKEVKRPVMIESLALGCHINLYVPVVVPDNPWQNQPNRDSQ